MLLQSGNSTGISIEIWWKQGIDPKEKEHSGTFDLSQIRSLFGTGLRIPLSEAGQSS